MKRTYPFLIAILFALMFTLLTGAQATDPLDAIDRAMSLLQNGETDAARDILAGVEPVANASGALVLSAQGIAEMYGGQFAVAEDHFHQALQLDAGHLAALWGLSLCLLSQHRAFEATTKIDLAAVAAPADVRIKALQAYSYLILGRLTDAAQAGKIALEGGEQSPFLMATLAQIYRRMGYAQKALEFGSFAAKSYYGMDFLAPCYRVNLPLTMIITDTPSVLSGGRSATPKEPLAEEQRTDLEVELPKTTETHSASKPFEIVAPLPGSTVRGVQHPRVMYRGTREIKFIVFLVDRVMRGMKTELPYQFYWDADTSAPGEHQLGMRAYDNQGLLIAEDVITVTSTAGKPCDTAESSAHANTLQQRMIDLTMPEPMPLSLFTHLGWWHKDVQEKPQAIAAFEKAAAIDPTAEGVLKTLAQMYAERGLHLLSSTGEISQGPSTGRKRVALTFDDGPNPLYTPGILSELKRYDAHATFFVVGKMVQQYSDLALQTLAEGHELANHSYTHPNLTKLKQDEIIAEVLRTRAVIKEIAGQQTYLFRPPGGNIDTFVAKQLRALDYNIVYWDINAGEYRKFSPKIQAGQIVSRVQNGSIVLLHNGPVDGTLNILPTILAELHKRGYQFVTVSELMRAAGK